MGSGLPPSQVHESLAKIVFGPPTQQGKLPLFSVPHKFGGMKPCIYCAILFSILTFSICISTYVQTYTHTHIRVIAFDRGRAIYDVCVYVCECVSVCLQLQYRGRKSQYRGNTTRTVPIKRGRIFWQPRTYTL